MTGEQKSLTKLRGEIDSIDDGIHDLVMRRAALAEQIRAQKEDGNGVNFRPGREAAILRRLAARHQGAFSKATLLAMWRQMMAALVRLQGPFEVALWGGDDEAGYWVMARDHFGGEIPIKVQRNALAAIRAVIEGAVAVAVLPVPEQGEDDPWWKLLASDKAKDIGILAALPFIPQGNGRGRGRAALVIGPGEPEATERDHSFILIAASGTTSAASLVRKIEEAGFQTVRMVSSGGGEEPPQPLLLVEVADFVRSNDRKLADFIQAAGDAVISAAVAGAYAVPFTEAELATQPGEGP